MDLGTIIRKEIKRQGKTQKQVAEIIGISSNSMSQICNNATFPHKKTLVSICKCLNVEIAISMKRNEMKEQLTEIEYTERERLLELKRSSTRMLSQEEFDRLEELSSKMSEPIKSKRTIEVFEFGGRNYIEIKNPDPRMNAVGLLFKDGKTYKPI